MILANAPWQEDYVRSSPWFRRRRRSSRILLAAAAFGTGKKDCMMRTTWPKSALLGDHADEVVWLPEAARGR